MKFFLLGILTTLLLIALGTFVYLHFGFLRFNADEQPSALESKLAMSAVDAFLERRAPAANSAPQSSDADLLEGMKLYTANCAVCHGDPGQPERVMGKSFYPPVPQFMNDPADMPARHNFYIIKHGIRWTGMPAWGSSLNDAQIWTLTAFLAQMDKLPPAVDQEWKKGASTTTKDESSGTMKPMTR